MNTTTLKAQKINEIEKGNYTGLIQKIEFTETESKKDGKKYAYIDMHILLDQGNEIKVGFPAKISKKTTLGKFVNQFTPVIEGEEYNLEELLTGERVRFDVNINTNGYAQINPETMVKE